MTDALYALRFMREAMSEEVWGHFFQLIAINALNGLTVYLSNRAIFKIILGVCSSK